MWWLCLVILVLIALSYTRSFYINKKRVAFCLVGGVSKYNQQVDIYTDNEYINYRGCYNSIKRHIFDANSEKYQFDTYIHCWNPDIQEDLVNLYNPKKYLFEDNTKYKDQHQGNPQVSKAISIKRVSELVEGDYDVYIIYRPDLILIKDMNLDDYEDGVVYSNGYDGGDFHFVMNKTDFYMFADLFECHPDGDKYTHTVFKNHVNQYMNKTIQTDSIRVGSYQEVVRKVFRETDNANLIKVLPEYGFTTYDLEKMKNTGK